MNYEIKFYIIGMGYGAFERLNYSVVLSKDSFDDKPTEHEALYYLESYNIISDLQNTLDYSSYWDFDVTRVINTTQKPTQPVLLSSENGKLIFSDDLKRIKDTVAKETRELIAKEAKREEAKKEEVKVERKVYPSIWMEPNGTIHQVGFAQHNEWAHEYFEKRDGIDHYQPKRWGGYAYEDLQDEGWIRVLGWTDPPTWSFPKTITSLQRRAIKGYCQDNSCKLPNELNKE